MGLLGLWVARKKEVQEQGRLEAWRLKAQTLNTRRRGGVVEARDGRFSASSLQPSLSVVVGHVVV